MNITNKIEEALYNLKVGQGVTINVEDQVPIYEWHRAPGGWVCTIIIGNEKGTVRHMNSVFVPEPFIRPKTEESSKIKPVTFGPGG